MNRKERDAETMNRLRNIELAVQRIEAFIKGEENEKQDSEGTKEVSGAEEENQK